jgi:uncharacterized protein
VSENILKNRYLCARLPSSDERTLVLLTGSRQTGKTTIAHTKYPELKYFDLDALEFRDQLNAIGTFAWGATVGKAILDEVQKAPQLFDKIKYAFDSSTIDFTILLGSAQILLLNKVPESLAGRVLVYDLWPLALGEITSPATQPLSSPLFGRILTSPDIDALLSAIPTVLLGDEGRLLREQEEYLLQWGGMPGLLPLNVERRWEWLRSYEQSYLERDLSDLARLTDLSPFRTFQKLAAARSGGLLSYSQLASDARISVETARRYMEYLRISYQGVLLQPYASNLTSSVVKTPKLYWSDCGLWRQLTGVFHGTDGRLFENYVVMESHKLVRSLYPQTKLWFYRTRSGMEVDLLCETETGIIGIEVKSSPTVTRTDFRAIRQLAEALKERWLGGMVVYRGDELRQVEPKMWAMPSFRLLTPGAPKAGIILKGK